MSRSAEPPDTVSTVIRTERLDLIPMTPGFLRASIDGDLPSAASAIGLSLPDDWPDDDIGSVLELRLKQLEARTALQPWLLRAIGLRSTQEMVGHIGFHDAPGANYLRRWCPGGIELGFSIFAPHRRNGYAREASTALMDWARDACGVTAFVVTIRPDNIASLALAASLGFVRVGSHVDEIDGAEEIFVREAAGRQR